MTVTQKHGGRVAVVMVMVAVIFASLIAAGAPAHAVVKNADSYKGYSATSEHPAMFYAYVKAGERMRVSAANYGGLTVLNEHGKAVKLDSQEYTPRATSDGVWQVALARNGTPEDGFDYDLSVRSGTTEKKGRIWVYQHQIYQRAADDLNYFGVSDLGYVYEINLHGAKFIGGQIVLRSAGAAAAESCEVENRSFEDFDRVKTDCGDRYRLFFEDPRGAGLPETANMAGADVPVLPTLVNSRELKGATKVVFTPNAAGAGGSFVITSHPSFSGTAELEVDADNNGVYTDQADFTQTIVVNGGKSEPWVWDGKDGTGREVSGGAKARVAITKGGEAHLMMSDVEVLTGLTMTRLNGDSAPDSTIYWDDRRLTKPRGGAPTPVKSCLDGCNSKTSDGNGVHGWNEGKRVPGDKESLSWGDGRVIDNWAYASVNAVSPTITLPKVHTLTFNGTGGSISDPASIRRSDKTAWGTLPTATQTGKVFLGWQTAKTGGTSVTSKTVATDSITAYAQWRPARFNVVFDGNAQMGAVSGATGSVSVETGCTDCRLPDNGFTKTTGAPALIEEDSGESAEVNSAFLGWSLDPFSRTGDIADRALAGKLSQTDGATVRLYAIWDDAPRFIVHDYPNRYFTLKAAQAGYIDEEELLGTVQVSDQETTTLKPKTRAQVKSSGSDVGVTVFDYDAQDFTAMTDTGVVTVTYKVKDEAANVAFLRIRVTVSDDGPLQANPVEYLRGISSESLEAGPGRGGLLEQSLWLSDPTRQAALDRALSTEEPTRYCLDVAAISELRAQIQENGLGNSTDSEGLAASAGVLQDEGACT